LVFGAVIIGLAAYGLSRFRGGPDSAAAQASSSEVSPHARDGDAVNTARADLSDEHQRERRATTAAVWPADPFWRPEQAKLTQQPVRPDPGTSGDEAPLTLTGVISGPAPLAMINGRVVAVGDQVLEGVVVTAIDGDSVTLQTPGGEKTLTLPE
jgi:hypothetical protein